MSNLIKYNAIADDIWQTVRLPALPAFKETERKQAGKVVLFKLTGEKTVSAEQIASAEIPATGHVLIPVSLWIARQQELADRLSVGEIGVWLDTHETIESLLQVQADLNVFPLIGIHVERFADGRIFSLGTLLRTRYGYKHELRAFGDVLRDQLFFLKRSGFDSYLIRADRSAADALKSLHDFTEPYQGAVDQQKPAFRRYNRGVE